MRRSYTAVLERGEPLAGEWATEPYEAGWASEALFFVRLLEAPATAGITARVQLSPDGMRWVDEGTALPELRDGLAFARVREFGNWLRLAGTVSGADQVRALIYLTLKE
jgi:hypothetical protein